MREEDEINGKGIVLIESRSLSALRVNVTDIH